MDGAFAGAAVLLVVLELLIVGETLAGRAMGSEMKLELAETAEPATSRYASPQALVPVELSTPHVGRLVVSVAMARANQSEG